jgi:hypothetical protein
MAERQSHHRQEIETRIVNHNVRANTVGQYMGFILAALGIVGGVWLLHEGKITPGYAVFFANFLSLVALFVASRREPESQPPTVSPRQ